MLNNQLAFTNVADENFVVDPSHVTFQGGKEDPFCRWYPYLEGYSPEFVLSILRYYAPHAQIILDPFAGTATTAFTAAEKNLSAYICEVNPVMQFIFEVKTSVRLLDRRARNKLADSLRRIADDFQSKLEAAPVDRTLAISYSGAFGTSKFFDERTFSEVTCARSVVDELSSYAPLEAELLTVAILANLVSCSLLKRAGDVRYKTEKELQKGLPSFPAEVSHHLRRIADDICDENGHIPTRPLLICQDVRSLKSIPSLGVDTVITSPPYINGTNYFRNTKLELWFLRCLQTSDDLRTYRDRAITAGINDVSFKKESASALPFSVSRVVELLEKNAYDVRIPRMVASYFAEMIDAFRAIRKHLVNGATVAIDIGDSIYGGVHVPADELLADSLAPLGFRLAKREVLRSRKSKNGQPLKQVLLVMRYERLVEGTEQQDRVGTWQIPWQSFKSILPHQQEPYASRNWGHPVHSLCSYQGKLKPAIAHFLVKTFVPEGGSVLDPFAGVGTIPFEAALQGRHSYGFDLSPTAYTISVAKLRLPSATHTHEIVENLQQFISTYTLTAEDLAQAQSFGFNKKLVDYFHTDTLREVFAAKRFFALAEDTPSFRLVFASCLHILHGNRPYALSRRSHPITPYAPTGEFEYRPLIPRLEDKVRRTLETPLPACFTQGKMFLMDATSWWPWEVKDLDAVITSPPFFDSTRFYLANWMRLWFAGWMPTDFENKPLVFIDERQKNSFAVYESIIRQSKERLKPGGVVVLHLGKSVKCDMAVELLTVARRWFAHHDVLDESVEHCESHGIRDKGTVTSHQYLVLY